MEDHGERNNNCASSFFVVICSIFVVCLLLSNLISSKIICIANALLPAAVILFPITYVLGDVITEVYGFKKARLVIWTGFACNLFAVAIYIITICLPYPAFWVGQESYIAVLGTTPRILIASLLGFLFGELSNAIILSKLKSKMGGKKLWVRTVSSSLVGEAFDTVIFVMVSFFGSITIDVQLQMILFQFLFKVCYEIVLIPFTYFVVKWLKKKEGSDVYDYEITYHVLGSVKPK